MRKTPIHSVHKELGARMVEFAGWQMPVQYNSALEEHLAVRSAVGIFDVSHMGQIEISGKDALELVQKVTCNDVERLADGQAQYSALLYSNGTFVDDIVLYRIHAERIFMCVNASNQEKDFQWILQHQEGEVEVCDRSDQYAQFAVQGPQAEALLSPLVEGELGSLKYYWSFLGKITGVPALISRTGYTGEDGFEIYLASNQAESVWRAILEEGRSFGIKPVGLAARNTLRLEVRYPLYGNDIDQTTNPWEAGLGWIVKLGGADFVGKEALLALKQKGASRKLAGFELQDRGIARDHYPVFLHSERVGEVTSGSYAPSLGSSIGLAYLPAEDANPGQQIEIEVRSKRLRAAVVSGPFYQRV